MRGIQIDATRFRQIRLANGLTQQELAAAAGVAERTVRNAEGGRRVRIDFLRYLAVALGVAPLEIACDRDELRVAKREERNLTRLFEAIRTFMIENDLAETRRLLDAQVRLTIHGPPEMPIAGKYHGIDGMQTLMDRNRASLIVERPAEYSDIRTGGNLVVYHVRDEFQAVPTGRRFTSLCQHVVEFANERVVRMDEYIDPLPWIEAFGNRARPLETTVL
jgi:transcriptional regulator with XRE-family HTH domain